MAEIFKAADNFPGTVTREVFVPQFYVKAKEIVGGKR
jgi:hypothetical protein